MDVPSSLFFFVSRARGFPLREVLFSCASMRGFSSRSTRYFLQTRKIQTWFTDLVCWHIMLMVSGLVLQWNVSLSNFLFEAVAVRFVGLPLVVLPGLLRTDEKPVAWPEACCVVTNFLSVLDAQKEMTRWGHVSRTPSGRCRRADEMCCLIVASSCADVIFRNRGFFMTPYEVFDPHSLR